MGEEKTTECLYYRAFHSFLLQKPDFQTDFRLFQKQQESYPESLSILSDKDLKRLDLIKKAFYTGRFTLFEGSTFEFSNVILPENEKSEKPHQDLVTGIYTSHALEPYTGPIQEACFEYPVLDGSVDLMVQSDKCAYIVEVKTNTADHAIIGQVMKYYIGMCLKLILKFFDDIKIITVCPGYDPASYRGLRQIGATLLAINTKDMKISIV